MKNQQIICVEKISEPNIFKDHGKIKAAFIKNKIWTKELKNPDLFPLTISFKKINENLPIALYMDPNPNKRNIPIDPLENVIKNMNPKNAVIKVVKERIQPLVGLKFKFIKEGDGKIRISFNANNGSWSLVGNDALKDKSKESMNFGWINVATIMHEFGHALGLIHEHQNPKNNTIQWNIKKVDAWALETQGWNKATTQKNIINKYKSDQINGSSYDPKSIMLYFYPASLTKNNKGTKQNLILSKTDKIWISKTYPGGNWHQNLLSASFTGNNNKIIIVVIVVIVVIVLVFLLLFLFLRRKR